MTSSTPFFDVPRRCATAIVANAAFVVTAAKSDQNMHVFSAVTGELLNTWELKVAADGLCWAGPDPSTAVLAWNCKTGRVLAVDITSGGVVGHLESGEVDSMPYVFSVATRGDRCAAVVERHPRAPYSFFEKAKKGLYHVRLYQRRPSEDSFGVWDAAGVLDGDEGGVKEPRVVCFTSCGTKLVVSEQCLGDSGFLNVFDVESRFLQARFSLETCVSVYVQSVLPCTDAPDAVWAYFDNAFFRVNWRAAECECTCMFTVDCEQMWSFAVSGDGSQVYACRHVQEDTGHAIETYPIVHALSE
jgi:hypothetical protein